MKNRIKFMFYVLMIAITLIVHCVCMFVINILLVPMRTYAQTRELFRTALVKAIEETTNG